MYFSKSFRWGIRGGHCAAVGIVFCKWERRGSVEREKEREREIGWGKGIEFIFFFFICCCGSREGEINFSVKAE